MKNSPDLIEDESEDPYKYLPAYAEAIRQGEFAVGRFRGQTLLFIPSDVVDSLGFEKILKLTEQVYSKKTLDEWNVTSYLSKYLQIELPPQRPEDLDLVSQLIEVIKNNL